MELTAAVFTWENFCGCRRVGAPKILRLPYPSPSSLPRDFFFFHPKDALILSWTSIHEFMHVGPHWSRPSSCLLVAPLLSVPRDRGASSLPDQQQPFVDFQCGRLPLRLATKHRPILGARFIVQHYADDDSAFIRTLEIRNRRSRKLDCSVVDFIHLAIIRPIL